MCTCIKYVNGDTYFGRNLDLEYSFGEKVVVTPRNFPFEFSNGEKTDKHYAMIGMATIGRTSEKTVVKGDKNNQYPLYAEAVNEYGLSCAGLNFPENAQYFDVKKDKLNVSPFEIIPYILSRFKTVKEVKEVIYELNLSNIPFSKHYPLAPLHYIITDREDGIIIEQTKDGTFIYEDEFGVLTNNPPYPYHKWNVINYLGLQTENPNNTFAENLNLKAYGQGLGAVGIPGDLSPASRFIRAVFAKENSVSDKDEISNVTQYFKILDYVAMVKGTVITPENKCDITRYSCCVNTEKGLYYYKTYDNNRICKIDMYKENLNGDILSVFELEVKQDIKEIN